MSNPGSSMSFNAEAVMSMYDDRERGVYIPFRVVEIVGGWNHAIVYRQLAYWYTKMGRPFYKGAAELAEELYMGTRTVEKAIAELRKLGLIETKVKKANGVPTNYFTVNYEREAELLTKLRSHENGGPSGSGQNDPDDPNEGNVRSGLRKIGGVDSAKSAESLTESTNREYKTLSRTLAFAGKAPKKQVAEEKLEGFKNLEEKLSYEEEWSDIEPDTSSSATSLSSAKNQNPPPPIPPAPPSEPGSLFSSMLEKAASRQAKAEKSKKPRKLSDWQRFLEKAMELWNTHRRPEWVPSSEMTGKERTMLSSVWEAANKDYEAASKIVENGIKWIAKNEGWAENHPWAFSELISNDKMLVYHRKFSHFEARGGVPNHGVGTRSRGAYAGPSSPTTGGFTGVQEGQYGAYLGSDQKVYVVERRGAEMKLAWVKPNGEPDMSDIFRGYQDQVYPIFSKDQGGA